MLGIYDSGNIPLIFEILENAARILNQLERFRFSAKFLDIKGPGSSVDPDS